MKTFLVVDREIPADSARAAEILEKALKNADRIFATTPRAAAKLHYLRSRQAAHRVGRGHRNPPERTGQVKIVGKSPTSIGSREITRFTVGHARRDGVLTHYEDLNVVVNGN